MVLDLINSFLELIFFLLFFLLFTNWNMSKRQLVFYALISVILSALFSIVLVPQVLVLNIVLIISSVLVTFWKEKFSIRLVCSCISILGVLFLEFTLYTLLPVSLLHTNAGNLVVNVIILIGSFLVLYAVRKKESGSALSSFVIKYSPVIIILLLIMIVLGQMYISKLAEVWYVLPAVVGVIFLSSVIICLSLYLHFVNASKKQQNDLFVQNLENTESIITSCNTELHNYRSHINHLLNSINSIDNIQNLRIETNQYVTDLRTDREMIESIIALKEPLFRSTLYGWYVRCQELNVQFFFKASPLLPSFPIKQYLLVEALDILFSNALEYELQIPEKDRLIQIILYSDSSHSSFTIINAVEDVNQILSNIYSGKSTKNGNHKGIGLKHVRSLCNEHHMQFTNSADLENSSVSFNISFDRKEFQ